MNILEVIEVLNRSIGDEEFMHPHILGIPFEYLPNEYNKMSYEKYTIFVDKEDINVYIYMNDEFTFIYEIKTK